MSEGWPSDEIRDEASKLADENALPWLKIISANKEIARLEAEVAAITLENARAFETIETVGDERDKAKAEVAKLKRGQWMKRPPWLSYKRQKETIARLKAEVAERWRS